MMSKCDNVGDCEVSNNKSGDDSKMKAVATDACTWEILAKKFWIAPSTHL